MKTDKQQTVRVVASLVANTVFHNHFSATMPPPPHQSPPPSPQPVLLQPSGNPTQSTTTATAAAAVPTVPTPDESSKTQLKTKMGKIKMMTCSPTT